MLHDMDLFSRFSALVMASPENPLEVLDTFAASLVTVFGKAARLRMESGGEWGKEARTDLC